MRAALAVLAVVVVATRARAPAMVPASEVARRGRASRQVPARGTRASRGNARPVPVVAGLVVRAAQEVRVKEMRHPVVEPSRQARARVARGGVGAAPASQARRAERP